MAATNPVGIGMNADLDILFVLRHAVGGVALEVVPYLFDRIEFRRVLGEEFRLQAWVVQEHLSNGWPLMDLALVPQQDGGKGALRASPKKSPPTSPLLCLTHRPTPMRIRGSVR